MRDVESEDIEARREDDCVLGAWGSQQIGLCSGDKFAKISPFDTIKNF